MANTMTDTEKAVAYGKGEFEIITPEVLHYLSWALLRSLNGTKTSIIESFGDSQQ